MDEMINRIRDTMAQKEFTIKKTKFKVEKLNAWEGFPVAEQIRVAMSEALGSVEFDGGTDVIKSLLAVKPEHLRGIATDLFPHVKFKRKAKDNWLVVADAEEMAFGELEVMDVYEVILRAIAVNFSATIVGLISKSEGVVSALGLSKP